MPPSGNVIGSAVIEVTVDPSKIKAGFAQAGQVAAKETPKVAKQVDAQGGLLGAAGGIKQFSKPLREFREALQGTATAIFGMTGTIGLVVAGVAGIAAGLKEAFDYATNVSTAFDRTGRSVREATSANEALLAKIQAIDEAYRPKFDQASDTFNTEKYKKSLQDDRSVLEQRQRGLKATIDNYKSIVETESSALKALKESGKSNSDDEVIVRYQRIAHYAQLAEAAEVEYQRAARETPRAAQQAASAVNAIEAAQAEELRAQAAKLRQQVTEKNYSKTEQLNKAEADAMLKLQERASQFVGVRLDAYKELMAAMHDLYDAERREIQRNANEAIKAQQNVLKQANLDNTWRMVTGIEELGQKLDIIARQQRSIQ